MERYPHGQLLFFVNTLKINMQDMGLEGVSLEILQHNLLGIAADIDGEDVRIERLVLQLL